MIFRHLRLWLVAFLFTVFLMPLVLTPDSVRSQVLHEITQVEQSLGSAYRAELVRDANNSFNAVLVETGLYGVLSRGRVDEDRLRASDRVAGGGARALTARTNAYVLTAMNLVYRCLMRFHLFLAWAPYIAPFLVAVAVHGLALRRVKLSTFRASSPVAYGWSAHGMVALLGLPLMYLIAPFPLPPLFVPLWAMAAALPIIGIISNIQRMAA